MDIKKMTAVILAGGRGSRISEESIVRPKPMVTIGNKPILWHIMKIYSYYGVKRFIICCGYKGEYIKKYFCQYSLLNNDIKFELMPELESKCLKNDDTDWEVILANTGLDTLTAGRVLRIREYINDETFFLTYGDGVADIKLDELLKYHYVKNKLITISTTKPEGRFGAMKISDEGIVESFKEKARRNQSFVNMGFMVMNSKIFDYLGDGNDMLENGPFEKLSQDSEMAAYRHDGFWSPMDNINDRAYLEKLWKDGAPWKVW